MIPLIYVGFILISLLLSLFTSITTYKKINNFKAAFTIGVGQTLTMFAVAFIWWTNIEDSFISQQNGSIYYLVSIVITVGLNYFVIKYLNQKEQT